MSETKIEFYRHNIGEEEIGLCQEALASLFHTTGPMCQRFEEEFAAYLGAPHVVSLSTCTAALEVMLTALGVQPGDEVITTPMTFAATSTAVLRLGAKPVFVDVEPETANMRADLVEGAITPRTKAILPVHLYGNMCDMRKLRQIADRHGLALVADCAHAVESRRDGLGSADVADAACYSFYTTKNLACGEGGALAMHDAGLADRCKKLRLHGMSKGAADRYSKSYQHWDIDELGFKANLSDILAALLIPQIKKLPDYLARREELALKYERAFEQIDGVDFPRPPSGSTSARHLFTIWVDQRDRFLELLQEQNIGVAVNYRAIHLLTYFRRALGHKPGDFPVAERIGDSTISLPLYPKLSGQEAQRVIQAVQKVSEQLLGQASKSLERKA